MGLPGRVPGKKGFQMKRKKALKLAKKVRRYCKNTPCKDCIFYSDHCTYREYITPSMWPLKRMRKNTLPIDNGEWEKDKGAI